MFSKTKFVVASLLVIGLLAMGVGGAVVLAQGPTPTPAPKPGAQMNQLFWDALAKRLNTTLQALQQAIADARQDAINQGAKQGLITQAQANTMLQCGQKVPSGRGWFGVPFQRGFAFGTKFGMGRGFLSADVLEAVAKVLGMSPADVTSALRSGKTLADLAKEKQVDEAKVKTAIADAEKAALDRAVKDGFITQGCADALKAQIDLSKMDLSQKHFAPGGFPGRFGKR